MGIGTRFLVAAAIAAANMEDWSMAGFLKSFVMIAIMVVVMNVWKPGR